MFNKKTLRNLAIGAGLAAGLICLVGYGYGNGLRHGAYNKLANNIHGSYVKKSPTDAAHYSLVIRTGRDGKGESLEVIKSSSYKVNDEERLEIRLVDRKNLPLILAGIADIPILRNALFGDIDEIYLSTWERKNQKLEKVNGKYPEEYEKLMDEIIKELRPLMKKKRTRKYRREDGKVRKRT